MDIQVGSDGCPVGVACPMDGFQTDCPFLWTEKCPHWHPIETIDDLMYQRKQMNYEKFNDATCRLRQAEEDFNKAIQDIWTGFNEYEKEIKEKTKQTRTEDLQAQIDEAYNKGLEDARNAVLQLYDNENWHEIFGSYYNFNILKDHSMAEIIEKLNQLKAEKEKQAKEQDFHIGDEIICVNECSMDYDKTFIYLGRDEYHMKMFNLDKMKAEFTNNFVDYRKTGKHYDAIPILVQEE